MHLRRKLQFFSSLPAATALRESTNIAGKFPRLAGVFPWPEAVQASTNVQATASSWLSTTAHAGLCRTRTCRINNSFWPAVEGVWVCTVLRTVFFATPIRARFIYKMLFASKACQEELLVFSMSWSKALIRLARTKGTRPLWKRIHAMMYGKK